MNSLRKKNIKLRLSFLVVGFNLLAFFALGQTNPGVPSKPQEVKKKVSLDRSLEPGVSDEISSLFENVVAVQRKAKVKTGKFLFAPYLSIDFSDSPQTMYAMNLNIGYAAGEYFEIYLNYVPSYVNNERSISYYNGCR